MSEDTKALEETFTDPSQTDTTGNKAPPEPSNTPPAADPPAAPDNASDAAPKANDDASKEEPKVEPTEFVKYGDPEADAIVDFIKEAGMTPADAAAIFEKANASGKLEDIDSAKLTEKLGDAKAKMVLTAVGAYYSKTLAHFAAIDKAVYDAVGGEDNMKVIGTWASAKEESDPTFKVRLDAIRGLLQQGPVQAELAAKELKSLYNADSNNKTLGTQPVQGDNTPKSAQFEPISKADYFREMEIANRNRDHKKIAELNSRRTASKANGY